VASISIQEAIDRIIEEISISIKENAVFKLVTSKSRNHAYKQWIFSPYLTGDKGEVQIKWIKRTTTQDFTSHFTPEVLPDVLLKTLQEEFYFLDYHGNEKDLSIKQSKKGKLTLIQKSNKSQSGTIPEHNRKKEYLISVEENFLYELGVTGSTGRIISGYQKKFRQINKFIEIIDSLISSNSITHIADMGCGKGYLTFALYVHLKRRYPGRDIQITGYDIRQDLVDSSNSIAKRLGFEGLSFLQGNIGQIKTEKLDLLIALHACDIATDMAILQGVRSSASYIVLSPCCHKQIRKQMKKKSFITRYGIYEERTAEMITDTIRALLLENEGYQVDIFEFISSEHTSKNIMMTAQPGQGNSKALEKVASLKAEYGIDYHYLETLLK
jgi:SAM-dependent methyltransferase